MRRAKRCCRNCHFLNKTYYNFHGHRGNLTWSKEERDNLTVGNLGISSSYVESCWRGVWDAGIDPKLNEQLPELLTQNRGDTCFFIQYQEGMSYDGAIELQRERRLNGGNRRSKAAIAISVTTLLLGLIYFVVDKVWA